MRRMRSRAGTVTGLRISDSAKKQFVDLFGCCRNKGFAHGQARSFKTPVDFTNRFRFSGFGVRFEPCQDFLEDVQSNEIPPRRGPRPARVVLDRTPTAPGSVVVAVLALEHRAPMERRCAPVALARPRHVRNRGTMPGRSGDDAPKERGIYRKFDRGLAVRGERRSPLQNELGLPTCAAERLSGILVFEREQPLRFGPIAMLAQWTNETPV